MSVSDKTTPAGKSADGKYNSAKETFSCEACGLSAKFDYYGKQPPFVHHFSVTEDAYIMKDPFVDGKRCIILGAHCSMCNKSVCVSNDCSIFYSKRLCATCVEKHLYDLPKEIQKEIAKKSEVT